ncbi:hypothetical protein [Lysinibacillus odysseyi]|uniref:hypothetical protein n=1 Tax=Lysinibacillus odysseyi TaxID=202611 RepID=UPI00068C394B|nr:hypothetical protein [Lysinibacillus odysseyi]
MTYRRIAQMIIVLLSAIVLFGCSSNKMIDIEDSNTYAWQKYMNEDEFNQLTEGMSYMEVVKVAKGPGEQIDGQTYIWPDELLITRAYEIKFKDNQLVDKRIVQKRGESTRDLPAGEESADQGKADSK